MEQEDRQQVLTVHMAVCKGRMLCWTQGQQCAEEGKFSGESIVELWISYLHIDDEASNDHKTSTSKSHGS